MGRPRPPLASRPAPDPPRPVPAGPGRQRPPRGRGRQVGLLDRAGIAHGELVPANVLVDDDGRPWLVDFDQAGAASDRALLERDRAELLAALTALVGPERAKRTSEATLV